MSLSGRFNGRWTIAGCVAAMAAACSGPVPSGRPPDRDQALFESQVYPVVARDCGFPTCHGSQERFFRVYRPGGAVRMPGLALFDPPSKEELAGTFERAQSMLAGSPNVEQSLFLCKPLETAEGGCGHKGLDDFGRNVYRSREDPNYQTLVRWALTNAAAPPADASTNADAATLDGGAL